MAGAQTEEEPVVRCGCANDQCSCTIIAGDGIDIEGTGSKSNPYVVTSTAPPVDTSVTPVTVDRLPGEISMYGGSVAPTGWLICNGAAVNRNTYAALFAIIGTAYGAGDGSVTFNLPNFGGRMPIGQNGTYPRGAQGGAASVTQTVAQMPAHVHTINHDHPTATTSTTGNHDHPAGHGPSASTSTTTFQEGRLAERVIDNNLVGVAGAHAHTVDVPPFAGNSGTAGGGAPMQTISPYLGVNMIIKF